jgi:hypothetical protein
MQKLTKFPQGWLIITIQTLKFRFADTLKQLHNHAAQ